MSIYVIISSIVLLYPKITIYLAGSLISVGIVYSLISSGCIDAENKKRLFIFAAISSWIIVIGFLYGFFTGLLEYVFGKKENGP